MSVSLLQAVPNRRDVDRIFLARVGWCAVPAMVLALALALRAKVPLGIPIAAVLMLVGLRSLWRPLDRALAALARHEKVALIVTGVVHGASNLGGPLLTALVHQKSLHKDRTRATVAAAYALFAGFQCLTLGFSGTGLPAAVRGNLPAVGLGFAVYAAANALVYRRLDSQRYAQAFAVFLLLSGLTLVWREW
jgi:hypothetical protein